MTFAKMIQSNDALTKAMQICTVDLADGSCHTAASAMSAMRARCW